MFHKMKPVESKSELSIDIDVAYQHLLPINIEFERKNYPLIIRDIVKPIKMVVVDSYMTDMVDGFIYKKTPKTTEMEICFPISQMGLSFSEMVGKISHLSFKDKTIVDSIYGYISHCEYHHGFHDDQHYIQFDFVGIVDPFGTKVEKSVVEEQIKIIRRRFHFD